MKIYNLTLEQNKMVSAIINDLTNPKQYAQYLAETSRSAKMA